MILAFSLDVFRTMCAKRRPSFREKAKISYNVEQSMKNSTGQVHDLSYSAFGAITRGSSGDVKTECSKTTNRTNNSPNTDIDNQALVCTSILGKSTKATMQMIDGHRQDCGWVINSTYLNNVFFTHHGLMMVEKVF